MKTKTKAAKKTVGKQGYLYVEKNIYKDGNSYRVRVGSFSSNEKTLRAARAVKRILKGQLKSEAVL